MAGLPEFRLFGEIGAPGLDAATLAGFLDANPDGALLTINSPGGNAMEGAAMLAAVEAHGGVTVHVVGVAASAASLIMVGAQAVRVHPAAMVMIHDPAALIFGPAPELRKMADDLDKVTSTYAAAYSRHTGNALARVRAWMQAETWMTAEEAVALHFADEVMASAAPAVAVAAFDYAIFAQAPVELIEAARENGWTAAPSKPQAIGDTHA